MKPVFDLLVVGASFSGLAVASRAVQRGLRVIVIDKRKEPGAQIRTTGVLTSEAAQILSPPIHLIRRIPSVRVFTPALKAVDLRSNGYCFYATDTPNLMRWIASQVKEQGVELRFGVTFEGAEPIEGELYQVPSLGIHVRWIIGADGPRSTVAKVFGLGRNSQFLLGMEAEFTGVRGVDPDFLYTFFDSKLAPGYLGWIVPGCGVTQVGLACLEGVRPAFQLFLRKISKIVDLSEAKVAARRSGPIPYNRVVDPIGRNRVLLVGDAAGLVSPLTAGGIYTALIYSARAADLIFEYEGGRGPDPIRTLEREYPSFRLKRTLRHILNLGPPNILFDWFLPAPPVRAIAKAIYFNSSGKRMAAERENMFRREVAIAGD